MAFPGVFYWDGAQSVQLIMSAFKCPKVFGWKLLQTLKKCLIIRAPCPERRLGSRKFTHLLRSLGQKVSRPESRWDFRWQQGLHIAGTPSPEKHSSCVQTALWGDPHNALERGADPRRGTMPSTQSNTRSNRHRVISRFSFRFERRVHAEFPGSWLHRKVYAEYCCHDKLQAQSYCVQLLIVDKKYFLSQLPHF